MQFLKQFIERIEDLSTQKILDYKQPDIPIIFHFDLSVLAGEYYATANYKVFYTEIKGDLERLEKLLEQLDKKLKLEQALDNLDSEIKSKQEVVEGNTKAEKQKADPGDKPKISKAKELIIFFKKVRQLYLKLVCKAERDFHEYGQIMDLYNTNEIFDLNLDEELFRHQYEEVKDSEDFEFDIFQINIKLAEVDINLDSDEDTILKLNAYKNFLTKHQGLSNEFTNLILRVLLDKTKFLLYKVYVRKLKKAEEGGAEYQFYKSQCALLKENLKFYAHFRKLSDQHYVADGVGLPKDIKIKLNSESPNLTISEIHKVAKHFRMTESLKELTKINSSQKKVFNINYENFSFDEFAKASSLNLLENTELRVKLIKSEETNFKDIIKILQDGDRDRFVKHFLDIKSIDTSSITYYKDYYPYTILLEYFDKLYDFLIDHPLILVKEEKRKKLLEEGKEIDREVVDLYDENGAFAILEDYVHLLIQRFNHCFRYFSHKKFKPIYLSYAECRYKVSKDDLAEFVTNPVINGMNIELFVESSYILPDDYQIIKENWKGVKIRMDSKLYTLTNAFEIEYQLRYYEKSFKKEVENKEFKLVQALAMFIAIATLILGSIKATENRSVLSSIIIILGLGCVLLLFNYFIYWFIRSDKKIRGREVIILGLILLSIGAVYSLSRKHDEETVAQMLKAKSDSLSVYKNVVDSIRNSKRPTLQVDSIHK